MKTKLGLLPLRFLLLIVIGIFMHSQAAAQNEYFPATESSPVVLDHIVKAQYLPGEGYEPESRREFQLGKSAFSVRIKKSGGYWHISVYEGFKVSVGVKNVRTGSIVPQEVLYEGRHKLNLKSKLWEVTGLLEGEMMIEKDTRPKIKISDVHLPPKIKTKPFPKPKPNTSTTRIRKN